MNLPRLLFAIALLGLANSAPAANPPLSLYPANPHYFQFRGRPVILVGSSEHYGSVLNLGFNYRRYLDTIAADHLNCTRLFTGTYHELPGDFGIVESSLSPKPGDFICPWPRVNDLPGGKFDLTQFSPAYFARFHDFISEASRRNIVVEVNLFSPNYFDRQWAANPMNAANNINNVGAFPRAELYTLKHPDMLKIQDALVTKIVLECRDFDNVYFEVCNEPYEEGVPLAWQAHIAGVIRDAESALPARHLISMNVGKGSSVVDHPVPGVSIFNFHYCSPPTAVAQNWGLDRVIGFNETGFQGRGDDAYRMEGWEFLLAGGGSFINLDYSFMDGTPNGTSTTFTAPGGGSPALRRELGIMETTLAALDFQNMNPANGLIKSLTSGAQAQVLAELGKQYAIYIHGGHQADLGLQLAAGSFDPLWLDPVSGKVTVAPPLTTTGGTETFHSPSYATDVVLLLLGAGSSSPQ